MTQTEPDCSPRALLHALRSRYPDSPFLALGQTVFWDEPVKAVLRSLLDSNQLGGEILVGVHDTDYFAKTPTRQTGPSRFALLAHNDGSTRGLWSAAGEISTLFGSETLTTRRDFGRYGVPFRQLAAVQPEGADAFLDRVTEAFGWRGLVYTGSDDLIVHNIPLADVGDAVFEMLDWGFGRAVEQIVPGCCQDKASRVVEQITGWCREYRAANPKRKLTDLFQHVLPRLYELLLGHASEGIKVDCTAHLLMLNRETAALPRFRFVDLFLNPETRDIAKSAYNLAVTGTEIYALDKFGPGGLPFDIVLPDRGRGTLRVTDRVVFVETPQPVAIGLKRPVTSISELAEVLNARLGSHVTLVGKAVSLVSMLAQEFIFVFHEEGSMYVRCTRLMNDHLAAAGVQLDMRPILRIRYRTWDSLSEAQSTMRLPEHLASAFGQPVITAPEFAASWRRVMSEQKALLAEVAALRKPLDLIGYLKVHDPAGAWDETEESYRAAVAALQTLRADAAVIDARVKEQHSLLRALKAESAAVQQERGDHFRSTTDWTLEATACRAASGDRLGELEEDKHRVRLRIEALRSERVAIERGPAAVAARDVLAEVRQKTELARLRLVRFALLTTGGLPHIDHRPSAWWIPLVDSSGDWFRRIAATTELYAEPLLTT